MPTCGPLHGSIDGLVWPIFNISNSRPSREAKPREAGDTKTSKGIGLLGLDPKEQRLLCKVHLTRLS